MRKKVYLRLLRPAVLLWFALSMALGLFAIQEVTLSADTVWAAPAQQTTDGGNKPAGAEFTTQPTWSNIWYIVLIPIVVAILAVGLGYTIIKLTRDSG
jgi:hypothetical protein